MKKVMVLAAITAAAGAVSAQSTVSVYGIVDMGIVSEGGGSTSSTTKLSSGVASGSRIGFQGIEDLGGGMTAQFLLENGFQADTGTLGQGGLLFGRQAYVGLKGGYGFLSAGRHYSPYYDMLLTVDPFKNGFAGRTGNILATNSRVDNSLKYASPQLGEFSAKALYGFGEVAGNNEARRQYSASVTYGTGPFRVGLTHHNASNATGTDSAKSTMASAIYVFDHAEASAAYVIGKGTGATDVRDLLLGLSVPFGPHKLLTSYIRRDDRAAPNADAHQFAVGYVYSLSKRTDLYSSFARIRNENGAKFLVGNAIENGSGDRAFNVGVRHTF